MGIRYYGLGHPSETPMVHLVLGALFLVIVIVGYGIICPRTPESEDTRGLMRTCIAVIAWSLVLLSVALVATQSGIAAPTPLSTVFWLYATFMSLVLGAGGVLGVMALRLMRRLNTPPEE